MGLLGPWATQQVDSLPQGWPLTKVLVVAVTPSSHGFASLGLRQGIRLRALQRFFSMAPPFRARLKVTDTTIKVITYYYGSVYDKILLNNILYHVFLQNSGLMFLSLNGTST
jgi:hypothetical protein